ncbi:hypothetical protein KJA15_02390 [Patescibacteria group bacterium]|nr:hypothetical protein [Patescibacteria group bacterium]
MKLKISTILLFGFYFLFSFESALAIGIGTNPSFLDLELKAGQSKKTEILVYNLSKVAGFFQVFPDELNDWIKIEPNNFRLEAGEKKEVKITISAKEEGRKGTNLSVLAVPLDRQSFSVSPGLKIPLKLNIREGRLIFSASILGVFYQSWPWLIVGIPMVCLIGLFLVKYLKRKNKAIVPPENLPVETSLQ